MQYATTVQTDYTTLKEELRQRLMQAANNFVEIGYLLKIARDTDILKQSGYTTMGEFARREYGLTPDTASRFISIYEKFGDDAGHLQEIYTDHGYTKLVEMLQLPGSLTEEIPASMSREEIRNLKQVVKAEEGITPIEVMMEDKGAAGDRDDLRRMLYTYFEQQPDIYMRLWEAHIDPTDLAKVKETILTTMTDGGIGIVSTRVQGIGPMAVSFKGASQEPVMIHVRQDEKEAVAWERFAGSVAAELYEGNDAQTPTEAWESKYERKYVKFDEIAPAQFPTEPKKEPAKRETKRR